MQSVDETGRASRNLPQHESVAASLKPAFLDRRSPRDAAKPEKPSLAGWSGFPTLPPLGRGNGPVPEDGEIPSLDLTTPGQH